MTPERCVWDRSDDDGTWASTCGWGSSWEFNDGGPVRNEWAYCPGCGKPVEEAPEPEEDEGGEE